MKRWKTIQEMAIEISEIDKRSSKERKELNIAQCSHVASKVSNLYKKGGVSLVKKELMNSLKSRQPYQHQSLGLLINEKNVAYRIVMGLFKHHWFPLSRIRKNMKRINS